MFFRKMRLGYVNMSAYNFIRSGQNFTIFFQAEDGIRDFCLSRGLGDVYKRQGQGRPLQLFSKGGQKLP